MFIQFLLLWIFLLDVIRILRHQKHCDLPLFNPKREGRGLEGKYILKGNLEPSLLRPSFLGCGFWFWFSWRKTILGVPIKTWGFLNFVLSGKSNCGKWSHVQKRKRSNALFHCVRAGWADLQLFLISGLKPGLWTWPQLCKSQSGGQGTKTLCLPPVALVLSKSSTPEASLRNAKGRDKTLKVYSLRTTAFLLLFRSQHWNGVLMWNLP